MNTLDDVAKLLESAPPGGCTVFRRGIEALQRTFAIFPDRRKGRNTQYKLVDAVRSAFAVFFLQRSFLRYSVFLHICSIHRRRLYAPVTPRINALL